MYAAEQGFADVVPVLLSNGADVNAASKSGITPLMYAAGRTVDGPERSYRVARSIDYRERKVTTGRMKGHTNIDQALLAAGAEVNAKDEDGWTALMWAARMGSNDIVELLLSKGADVNAKDEDGTTALMYAAASIYEGRVETVQALLSAGADVNAKGNDGRTALSSTLMPDSSYRSDRIIQILKEAGAAKRNTDRFNQTISDATKAIEINPRNATAYNNRGDAYFNKGEYDKAISDFTKAIEINPTFAVVFSNRGFVYYRKQEYDKAWEDVHKAQNLGYEVNAKFLKALHEASGRN